MSHTTTAVLDRRFVLAVTGPERQHEELARDVDAGLRATPKRLACRWFYDADGSQLFEEICALPEYYLTRAEREILLARADAIAAAVPRDVTLVELGSGSAVKTRIVMDALLAARRAPGGTSRPTLRYVPIDISSAALRESAWALLRDYEDLEIHAVGGEYHDGLDVVRRDVGGPKLVLWLGSNIGNLDRDAAARFLATVRSLLDRDDRVLCGIDLRKAPDVLVRAYDDARGVTARFNKNVLVRINRELGGHFDLSAFSHRAVYEEDAGRVAMYLVSARAQRVRIDELALEVDLAEGEAIHTEDSFKYSLDEIDALARRAGFAIEARWLDTRSRFGLVLFAPSRVAADR